MANKRNPSSLARGPVIVALFLSAIWLLGIVSFLTLVPVVFPTDNWIQMGVMTVAALLPLLVIWLATYGAVSLRMLRMEAAQMRSDLARMRSGGEAYEPAPIAPEPVGAFPSSLRAEPELVATTPDASEVGQTWSTDGTDPSTLEAMEEATDAAADAIYAAGAEVEPEGELEVASSVAPHAWEPSVIESETQTEDDAGANSDQADAEPTTSAIFESVREPSPDTEPEPLAAPTPGDSDEPPARFTTRRDAQGLHPSGSLIGRGVPTPNPPELEPQAESQPALAFGTDLPNADDVLSNEDFLRALHFPKDADDIVGFSALRRALKDGKASALVQAAQDILTLLSQEGIYMDDLTFDRPRPDLWRRFAQGERGPALSALGGVRDRSSLALTAQKMREDTVFRDTAHHFLRRFDKSLMEFEPEMSDAELSQLSETRSALAFMLLGRVAGVFR